MQLQALFPGAPSATAFCFAAGRDHLTYLFTLATRETFISVFDEVEYENTLEEIVLYCYCLLSENIKNVRV